MALNTEKLRDHLQDDYPIEILGIYINRAGVRIQYREISGDEQMDRQLRKAQLRESIEAYIKKSAYMDAELDRDSKMMLQLESGEVEIAIQRVKSNLSAENKNEYRLRQDVIYNAEDQFVFATKFYSLDSKETAEATAETLRQHECSDDNKKFIIELQHMNTPNHFSSFARFQTSNSYSSIVGTPSSN